VCELKGILSFNPLPQIKLNPWFQFFKTSFEVNVRTDASTCLTVEKGLIEYSEPEATVSIMMTGSIVTENFKGRLCRK
jgi:hypothetical protein